jgi:hypothetical protein
MKKFNVSVFVSTLALLVASTAFAGSTIKYMSGGIIRVHDTINFPNYGEVRADRVCQEGAMLKTVIPAEVKFVCDKPVIDQSDSTRPRTVCATKPRKVEVPAQTLFAPLEYQAWECISFDHSDSAYPKCITYGYVTKSQSLTYTVETFRLDDYRQEMPSRERKTIQSCQ